MKRTFYFLFLLPLVLPAQTIKVVDATSLQPIFEVGIFNIDRSQFTKTNESGEFDISVFSTSDILEFQHPSYKNIILPFNDVLATKRILLIEEVIRIDEVVISASRWTEAMNEVPQKVVGITQQEIDFYNPQTAADALKISGQIFIQKSQLGGGSPMIRGFGANSVLITVNGIRMNNAIFRSGNVQNVINIDPNVLEGAEVVLGPGSVVYGSDALGGVMNFKIKTPRFSSTEKPVIKSSAFVRYSSANKEKTGHILFNLGGKRLSWLSSITYSDFDHLITGSKRTSLWPDFGERPEFVIRSGGQDIIVPNDNVNRQVFSGYSAISTIQRVKFRASSSIDLTYDFFYSTTTEIPRYDRLIEYRNGLPVSATWQYGPQEWMMNSLQASFYNPIGIYNEMRLTVANQQFKESRIDRRYQNPSRRTRTESVSVWSLNADLEKELSETKRLVYGLEAVYNDVSSEAKTIDIETLIKGPASTRYPDGGSSLSSIALYTSYNSRISEKTVINGGVRYSYQFLKSSFADTTFFNFPYDRIIINAGALTGNVSLVHNTISNWQFDFLLSSGFRVPNVDDVGKVFDSTPGNVVIPNENLRPEYSYNGEIGITKTIPGIFRVGATGFYTRLVDAMVRRNTTVNGQDSILYDGVLSQVEAIVNTGEAYITGVSADLEINISRNVSLLSYATIMNGRDVIDDVPLRHTTPAFGRTTLEYKGSGFHVAIFSDYQAARAFKDLAPTEQDKTALYTPDGSLSWVTWNINGSWQPNPRFQLNLALENILDLHYRPYSSGISAAGRNFITSLRINI